MWPPTTTSRRKQWRDTAPWGCQRDSSDCCCCCCCYCDPCAALGAVSTGSGPSHATACTGGIRVSLSASPSWVGGLHWLGTMTGLDDVGWTQELSVTLSFQPRRLGGHDNIISSSLLSSTGATVAVALLVLLRLTSSSYYYVFYLGLFCVYYIRTHARPILIWQYFHCSRLIKPIAGSHE